MYLLLDGICAKHSGFVAFILLHFFRDGQLQKIRGSSITVERRSFPERKHETENSLFVIKQKNKGGGHTTLFFVFCFFVIMLYGYK